jgi:hypothetical protein
MQTLQVRKQQSAFIYRKSQKAPRVYCKATPEGSSNERVLQDAVMKFKEAVQAAKEKRKEVRDARIASLKSICDTFKAIAEDEVKYVKSLANECQLDEKPVEAAKDQGVVDNQTTDKKNEDVFVDKL